MTQHVTAIYENGLLRPLVPLNLRDQEVVSISIESGNGTTSGVEGATLFELMEEAGLVGCVDDAPDDLSTNPKYMEGFGKSGS